LHGGIIAQNPGGGSNGPSHIRVRAAGGFHRRDESGRAIGRRQGRHRRPLLGLRRGFRQADGGGHQAFFKLHGDTFAGRKIQVLIRDTGGPNPEVAKRLAQELVTRDKVDFWRASGSPRRALAAAPVATEAKKPMIVMNAASSVVTTRSPYIARFSMTLPQVSAPMATWASKNGIKKVYTLVTDYAPGIDSEESFKKAFTALGGQVVDSVRVPLRNPEYAPYVQRIKDAKPEAVFMFVPAGQDSIAFMKAFEERGLAQAGIKLIATGDLTDDYVLNSLGDPVIGIVTTHHYSAAHDSPENKAFVAAFNEVAKDLGRPNFMGVGGYDGMAAIAEVVKKLGRQHRRRQGDGDPEVDEAQLAARADRDRPGHARHRADRVCARVEKRGGELWNVEFDKFENVKDPGK
jgi:branched-chain amino acid transport system substrate-binding protein